MTVTCQTAMYKNLPPAKHPPTKDPRTEDPLPEDPRPRDPRPEDPRPGDLQSRRPRGESPRGESPRGESPRGESSGGESPRGRFSGHGHLYVYMCIYPPSSPMSLGVLDISPIFVPRITIQAFSSNASRPHSSNHCLQARCIESSFYRVLEASKIEQYLL